MITDRKIINKIFDHVEAGEIDKAVFCCLRLARKKRDIFNSVMFMRELRPSIEQLHSAFYDDVNQLNAEAQKALWEITQNRWIKARSLDYSLDEDDEKTVFVTGVGDLVREVDQLEKRIADIEVPSGMGEFDTAAATERSFAMKARIRNKLQAAHTILERVRTRCLDYATRIEAQIERERDASEFMAAVQNDVHNYYAERDDSVHQKLMRAASLIGSTNSEDHALLLTSIRRAVKAVADYHYPPASEPVTCHDGNERFLGEEQYLNRLHEFFVKQIPRSTSGDLHRKELEFLLAFVKKLNDLASKGVHTEVSFYEAKQGLLGLYLFLSNMLAFIQLNGSATTSKEEF